MWSQLQPARRSLLSLVYRLGRPVSVRHIGRTLLRWTNLYFEALFYLPHILLRRFLRSLSSSQVKTRYFTHGFVLGMAILIAGAGLLGKGELSHADDHGYEYVTAFGSESAYTSYASVLEDDFLAKGNIVTTTIKAKRTQGIEDYVVQPGDTLSTIAYSFDISVKSLQWANQIVDINRLKPGDTITILPASGIIYKVKEGDTLESVGAEYGIRLPELIELNDLVEPVKLIADQEIIVPLNDPDIPDMPKPEPPKPTYIASNNNISSPGLSTATPAAGGAVGGGSFIWPASGRITQNFYQHWRGDGALDIANRSQPPIYASDSGVVTISGWDSTGYGNRVDINHGNGFVTRYAHMSRIYVSSGQSVSRGQVIGQMGCTGRCSGTHLHFMVIKNGVPVDPQQYL